MVGDCQAESASKPGVELTVFGAICGHLQVCWVGRA